MKPLQKKIILSGIQPTGIAHLGNYLGALKQWVATATDVNNNNNSKKNESRSDVTCYFSVMDLHALTTQRNANVLRQDVIDTLATLVACGIASNESVHLCVQSKIKQHAELCWILQCITPLGLLQRMTQYKEKTAKLTSIDLGLLTYPVLMAADVLLYKTTHVPVGFDQVQHLEFTRDLVDLFQRTYKYSFTKPEYTLNKASRIASLIDASKKMSKSEPNLNSRILLTDEEDVITKKISRAKTDSVGDIHLNDVKHLEARPEVNNLVNIYASLINRKEGEAMKINDKEVVPVAQFKKALIHELIQQIVPIGKEIKRIKRDEDFLLNQVVKKGTAVAEENAEKNMMEVRNAIGIM